MTRASFLAPLLGLLLFSVPAIAQDRPIYWGDEVPVGWTGDWPDELRTIPERTNYLRTMTSEDLLEFAATLRRRSEHVHVTNLFISPRGKAAPAIILANPRVTSPQQAEASGRPVMYLQGNIHPPEAEAAEALLMVARDVLFGDRQHLLDNQVIVLVPIYNVDGTDTRVVQGGGLGSATPDILGVRENSQGLDLNRDGVKLETVEGNGLYEFLNDWDPVLFLDGHLMGRVTHGYANTYGTTTVPAAHPGPVEYIEGELFPAVREMVRSGFGLEVFTHALFEGRGWPPTGWSHDRAAWTVDAKFVVNDYGLRNRFSIITETPGQPTFERRIYAQYAYFISLLEYTNEHAQEMRAVVDAADEETTARVLAEAEAGTLRNWLDGEYHSRGDIDALGYRDTGGGYIPGTSVRGNTPGDTGPPEVVSGIPDLTLSVGTRDASVPRAYILPPELADIAAKLEAHNIEVETMDAPMRVQGEEFVIETIGLQNSRGYQMVILDGAFSEGVTREFPAGSFFVDMAQPMANAAFYYLEPQARDGFVGWHVMDPHLEALDLEAGANVYPVFKYRRDAG